MSITTEVVISTIQKPKIEFPTLRVSDYGTVFLVISPSRAVVVHKGQKGGVGYTVGRLLDGAQDGMHVINNLKPFIGSVTLTEE